VTTLANLRAKLNAELGVDTDAETAPYSLTLRNNAIADGYAELWRAGVWKPATQDITSVDATWSYALTSIREAHRVEVLDSVGFIQDQAPFTVEDDGAGGYLLFLRVPVVASLTLRVRGWQPYISTFASDSATDDLPAADNRVPLLKAKAICFRSQLARFARYGSKQVGIPKEMQVTVDQLLGMIAAAEREFDVEVKRLAAFRPRTMKSSRVLQT